LIRKLYEQFSKAFPLVGRQSKDAGNIVIFARFLLLAEVAHNVVTIVITLAHNIKLNKDYSLEIVGKEKFKLSKSTGMLGTVL